MKGPLPLDAIFTLYPVAVADAVHATFTAPVLGNEVVTFVGALGTVGDVDPLVAVAVISSKAVAPA
ncbi:hypothetical protein D3C85_1845890 [compost metagenome]